MTAKRRKGCSSIYHVLNFDSRTMLVITGKTKNQKKAIFIVLKF